MGRKVRTTLKILLIAELVVVFVISAIRIESLQAKNEILVDNNNELMSATQKLTEENQKLSAAKQKLEKSNQNLAADNEKLNSTKVNLTGTPLTVSSPNLGTIKFVMGSGTTLEKNEWTLVADKEHFTTEPIIYGHNAYYGEKFNSIKKGEYINVTNAEGQMHSYEVTNTEIIDADKPVPVKKDKLILYTCYPFDVVQDAPKRYVIHGQKII